MKLTKKGEYALRTMIQLGIAQRDQKDWVSVSTLALAEQLPFKFIEQILTALRGAGYVESKRGKVGGVRLAKPQSAIRMGEIVRLIDGKLAPIGCASETAYEPCTCPDEDHCGLRMLMIDVRNAIANILDRYTLEDVVEVTLRKRQREQQASTENLADVDRCRARERNADPADGFLAYLVPH